jgi:predicted transposase YbfD/YdcC
LRGTASGGHDRPVHLLAAMDHTDGAVLAQLHVDDHTNEVSQFQPLLADLDLAGVVVTADPLHTQRDHAGFLIDAGADDLLVVKANQPTLRAQFVGLPWRTIPVMDRARDHGHGRVEIRTLKVATVAGLCFPHAAQAIQVTRRVRQASSRRWRIVTVYAVTSLTIYQAAPPTWPTTCAGIAASRRCNHIRDVTFAEDAATARTGRLPRVMASLRNLAIGALRLTGHPNLAAAPRHTSRDPARPLAILGLADR